MIRYKKKILKHLKLSEINFKKSNLSRESFQNKQLKKCDFWESQLENTNFKSTLIEDSIFTDCNLFKSSFLNSILIDVNFTHANLRNVNFKKCTFKNINLRDAIYNDKTKWPKNFSPESCGAIKEVKKIKSIKSIKIKKTSNRINQIVKALTKGKGYYIIENYFEKKNIYKAQKVLRSLLFKDKKIRENQNKFSKDKKFSQKWITNLLNIDPVFKDFIQPKLAMDVFKITLGDKFICGFFEANCMLPGARGQFPHIDYPYNYNYGNGENIPFNTRGNFLFNCQILIPLHDINENNGSTAFLDNSYKLVKFPKKNDVKKFNFKQVKARLGSMILFNGLTWHTSMPNYTYDSERFCILGQYLPHFIKPMIDIKSTTKKTIYKNNKILKQLFGVKLPFPLIKK